MPTLEDQHLPFFSVVVPTYNRASTIARTLESVRIQTWSNFECIIVDDGSLDGPDLADAVSRLEDRRFRVIRQDNAGGGAARNKGVAAAKGNFIAFLDSDDFFLPNKLSDIHAELVRPGGDDQHTVLFSQIFVERGKERTWIKPSRAPHACERIDDYLILNGGFIQTSSIVIPREVARDVRFDEALPFGQDTDFCIRLAAFGCSFSMMPEPLVVWTDDSTLNRVSNNRRVDALLSWTDRVKPLISKKSYLAYRGWHGAKAAMSASPILAVKLFTTALVRGAFSPKLAARVSMQIFLPPRLYRNAANWVVTYFGVNLKDKP